MLAVLPRPTDALPREANRRVVLGDGGGPSPPPPLVALPIPPRVALRLRLRRRIRWASLALASDRYGLRRYADDDRPGLAAAGGGAPAAELGVVGGSIPALPALPPPLPTPGVDGSISRLPLRCLCRRMICSSSGDMPALPPLPLLLLDAIVIIVACVLV